MSERSRRLAAPSGAVYPGNQMKLIDHVYTGACAKAYDETRIGSRRWQRESFIIEPVLRAMKPGSTILDIAAGTGRWLNIYRELSASVILLDTSEDMLAQAKLKAKNLNLAVDTLLRSALDEVAFPSADCAVVTNFLNWINIENVKKVLTKTQKAGIRDLRFMITYLPHSSSADDVRNAKADVDKNNLSVRMGVRDKGIYYLHEEHEVMRIILGAGLIVHSEDIIVDLKGRRNVFIWSSTC